MQHTIAISIGLIAFMAVAAAQPAPETPPPPAEAVPAPAAPEGEDARYSFHRVADGYLRLDVRTGQVAHCSRRQVGWTCQVVPEDRQGLENEIARLQAENGVLKKELLARGIDLPSGLAPPRPAAAPARAPEAGTFERGMRAVARVWLRMVERIAEIKRDLMQRL